MPKDHSPLRLALLIALLAACHDEPGSVPREAPGSTTEAPRAAEPPSAEAREAFAKGRQLFAVEKPFEAIGEMQRAVDLAPGWADAHLALGKLLATYSDVRFSTAVVDRNRLGQAIAELETACKLAPSNADAAYWAGHALHKASRTEEAARRFEAALALQPGHGLAAKELGLLRAEEGDPKRSIEVLQRARTLLPKDDEVLFALGMQYENEERLEEARDAYLAAAALNTGHPGPRSCLVRVYRLLGDPAASERMNEEFDRCRAFGKRITAASQHFDEHSSDPAACMGLAELYDEIGMVDAAANWAERARRLDPTYAPATALLEKLGRVTENGAGGSDRGAIDPAPLAPRDDMHSKEEQ